MANLKGDYKKLEDVSGSMSHGPEVLTSFLKYKTDPLLDCSSKEKCRELVTSKNLHNGENKVNTLTYIQGQALPELYRNKKINLIPAFFYSNDMNVRCRAIATLEKLLWNIKHYADTTDLLEEAEEIMYDVLSLRLKEWRFLSEEDGIYFQSVVRLYMMTLAAHARACLQESKHTHFEDVMKAIRKRKPLSVADNNKELQKLSDLLRILVKYTTSLSTRYGHVQKFEKMVVDGKEPKLGKEPWYLLFATYCALMTRFFKQPSLKLTTKIGEFLKCFKGESSLPKKSLTSDIITKSLVLFLVQKIPSGNLLETEIPTYSEKLVEFITQSMIPDDPTDLDMLLFLKERTARTKVIDYFINSRCTPYRNYIVNSNIRMIETLLSDIVASFEVETVSDRGVVNDWRVCRGAFGDVRVLLNIYIPDQTKHRDDIYVHGIEHGHIGPFQEIQILRHLPDHKHLVKVLALSVSKLPYFYVTEDSMYSNLQAQLIRRNKDKDTFSPQTLLMFLHHVASAVNFIHSHKIVHNSLTAASVFLDGQSQNAKLGNFSLANHQEEEKSYLGITVCAHIPTRWLAPECLRNRGFSKMSDIWMFGCLMYEVLTHGCFPYSEEALSASRLAELIIAGRKKLYHEKCILKELFEIIVKCTSVDLKQRPTAGEIGSFIKSSLKAMDAASGLASGGLGFPQYPDLETRGCHTDANIEKGIPDRLEKDWTVDLDVQETYGRLQYERLGDRETNQESGYDSLNTSDVLVGDITHKIPMENRNDALFRLAEENLPGIPKFDIKRNEREDVIRYSMQEGMIGTLSAICRNRKFNTDTNMYVKCLIAATEALDELHSRRWVLGDILKENIAVLKKTGSNTFTVFWHKDQRKLLIHTLPKCRVQNGHMTFFGWKKTSIDRCHPATTLKHVMFPNFDYVVFIGKKHDKVSEVRRQSKRCPPEVINDKLYSPASDVFSFGLMMWEVFGSIFGVNRQCSVEAYLSKVDDSEVYTYFSSSPENRVLEKPAGCPDELYDIVTSCWSTHRSQRPQMSDIARRLTSYMGKPELDDIYESVDSENIPDGSEVGGSDGTLSMCSGTFRPLPDIPTDADTQNQSAKRITHNDEYINCMSYAPTLGEIIGSRLPGRDLSYDNGGFAQD